MVGRRALNPSIVVRVHEPLPWRLGQKGLRHLPFKQASEGSSPSDATNHTVPQMAEGARSDRVQCEFESRGCDHTAVAQWISAKRYERLGWGFESSLRCHSSVVQW